MIDPELRGRNRRLFFAEHWKVGTIAGELGIHHETVEFPRGSSGKLYDNLKSVVLERAGDHVRFHPSPARMIASFITRKSSRSRAIAIAPRSRSRQEDRKRKVA